MLHSSNPANVTRDCPRPGIGPHSIPATGWKLVALLAAGLVAALTAGPLQAELKGTNATFNSWDDDGSGFVNSNASVLLDGKWHPFFSQLNFDNNEVDPAAADQSDGAVSCSTVDTDGNGQVGTTTPWAGVLRLSVDHIDTGTAPNINGFRETRCWELAVCDRETDGTGDFDKNADHSLTPRYKRFTIDITDDAPAAVQGACPTENANDDFGYGNPTDSNGFITLLARDVVRPCEQSGRCDSKIDTDLYINLDRDCDGTIDYDASQSATESEGNLSLIGNGNLDLIENGTEDPIDGGLIPLPVGGNDPDICFYAESVKPDFLVDPQWTGNIQARITAPPGGSGEKTVNHSLLASPVLGDVGDLPDANTLPDWTSYPTATHVTNASDSNPFLGFSVDNDTAAFSSLLADADDLDGDNDEDGVSLQATTQTLPDGTVTYTANVTANNPSADPAQLCGWFDFNQDGVLGNVPNSSTTSADPAFDTRTDTGERVCHQVPSETTEESFQLVWTIPESAQTVDKDNLYFRFRISTDPDMTVASLLAPDGGYESGEVEDYNLQGVSSLPVSISAFEATRTPQGLRVEWETVSETHNAGFHILTLRGDNLRQLNEEMIPPKDAGDALTPRHYEVILPNAGGVKELIVTAVDYDDTEEMFGLFEVGKAYGQPAQASPIDWHEARENAAERQMLRAAAGKGKGKGKGKGGKNTASSSVYADVQVSQRGLQAVTWEDLADAGLDLSGVPLDSIAVSLKGQPVARDIVAGDPAGKSGGGRNHFGPGDEIRFWGSKPDLPDALYIDDYNYRISVDPDQVVAAEQQNRRAGASPSSHFQWLRRDDEAIYQFGSPTEDPWLAKQLWSGRDDTLETAFDVPGTLITDQSGRVEVLVGGLTITPEDPDHHIVVEVNGREVGEAFFDDRETPRLDFEVPPGVLGAGRNSVTVRAPGGTAARFDMIAVDTVSLGFPSELHTDDDRLLVETGLDSGEGLSVSGFGGQDVVAYARDRQDLHRLRTQEDRKNDRVSVPAVDGAETIYWLSTADRLHRPDVETIGTREDLLADTSAELLVIAHPAFMPISDAEAHPLNEYIAQRESEGWSVALFDVTDIQAEYATGMPLPGAVTDFLKDADQRMEFGHVLLVGGDSYDYTDNLGLGSISFIPTRYAPAKRIPHAPSDALLADLDGDGLSDKAIGRWPVRSPGDLASIVIKTLEWPEVAVLQNAIWVTDSDDPKNPSFQAQAERMIDTARGAGWTDEQFSRLFWEDVDTVPGQSIAETARERLFTELEQGRALTGFVGHGSPAMWTFQGLVRPRDLDQLHNEGAPTLIGTLTCYTSYFVSPSNNSVAHAWMNGYRTDADGQHVAGAANGAVAIHGAATLSNYNDNETYARAVLDAQLDGKTLGEAVEAGRAEAARQGLDDLVVNWNLLGDPTLQLR
ncbi:C25 family cysteine peptidase [Wenzhouxiangella sp. EGI_FJ10305]|uniref:C25 family cysteine peptidase n=1 Tax=Wenzhouxiangella sp. EGI_FJ10305 TaxID=3243768 RepID=UPI0035D6D888